MSARFVATPLTKGFLSGLSVRGRYKEHDVSVQKERSTCLRPRVRILGKVLRNCFN